MKVLLIEDENDIAEVYSDWLEALGYEVQHCSNGYTAGVEILDLSNDNSIGFIITDLHVPGKSGEELVDFFEKIETRGTKIPILFLSGFIDDELRYKYQKLDHIHFLDKPTDKETFGKMTEILKNESSSS
jgi:FixJ family two-component response regulator